MKTPWYVKIEEQKNEDNHLVYVCKFSKLWVYCMYVKYFCLYILKRGNI